LAFPRKFSIFSMDKLHAGNFIRKIVVNELCSTQQFILESLASYATARLMLNFSSSLIYRVLCHSRFITCCSHSFYIWRELGRIQCANLPSVLGIYDSTGIKWSSSANVALGEALPRTVLIKSVFDKLKNFSCKDHVCGDVSKNKLKRLKLLIEKKKIWKRKIMEHV